MVEQEGSDVTEQTDPGDPVEHFRAYTQQLERGQWGRMWETLHPAHQEIIDRNALAACMSDGVEPGLEISDVEVVETYEEPVTIPATEVEVDSLAVTWSATYSLGEQEQRDTQTAHLVDVDGEWRWYLAEPWECGGDAGIP